MSHTQSLHEISPLQNNTQLSNLSLTNQSWWEKTLLDDHCKKKLATDEDLYSYSKFSNLSSASNHKPQQDQTSQSTPVKYSQLQKLLADKDQIIYKIKQERITQVSKLELKIEDLQKQLSLAESQLHGSLRRQGLLEQENTSLKRNLMMLEQQIFELQNKQSQICEQNESLSQELEITKIKLFERKTPKENQRMNSESTYRTNKSLSSSSSKYDQQQMEKFVDCIVDMVKNCNQAATFTEVPNLKKCWKWLKSIFEDYIKLKQASSNEYIKKNSSLEQQTNGRKQIASNQFQLK